MPPAQSESEWIWNAIYIRERRYLKRHPARHKPHPVNEPTDLTEVHGIQSKLRENAKGKYGNRYSVLIVVSLLILPVKVYTMICIEYLDIWNETMNEG